MEEQATMNHFLKKKTNTSQCRHIRRQVKKVMTSFRYYDNSDIASIITNLPLKYVKQLWWLSFQISVNGKVVNAQTWEVLPMINRHRATLTIILLLPLSSQVDF